MHTIFIAFAAGVLSWSFAEYCIHRWAGHDARLRPNPFEMEHTRHHARGNYFAPSWKKIVTALAALALVALLAAFVVGFRLGLPYAIGFAGFYMTYERVHRRAHTHAGTGPYARFLRRHHFWHHFENPKANHGVTSPIWDYVFGTRESPKMIHVPRKLAMEWLVNPATDEVFPDFGADYALRGKAPAAS